MRNRCPFLILEQFSKIYRLNMRDDFPKITKDILAKRVGYKCSNPNCRKITIGPHSIDDKAINLGVAAHITAASQRGPRFSVEMTSDERKSIKNGIWLCQNCAKLIDTDIVKFSIEELLNWKLIAEKKSLLVITTGEIKKNQNSSLFEERIKVYEELYYEIREIDSLIREVIESAEITIEDKKDAVIYLGFHVAKFTDEIGFHLQHEIVVQCIGTFVGNEDIFSSDEKLSKQTFDTYNRNIRASQELLKSVDSQGLIDTSRKTPLMKFYSELEAEQRKNDYL